MQEHPIESLMEIAMNNIQGLVDVNTIIGEPIELKNDICIIPISKVAFGFATGGSEFKTETIEEYKRQDKDEEIKYKNPFGGGSGAGVGISPVAFLIINEGNIRLMPVQNCGAIDKVANYIPDLMNKVSEFISNKSEKETIGTNETKSAEQKKGTKKETTSKQTIKYEYEEDDDG